jgi:hypothetical protein
MPSKSDVSVLTLEWWMTYYVDDECGRKENNLKNIEPIMRRDGWYFNRRTKLEWYEYKGLAFIIPRNSNSGSMFLYNIELLNAPALTQREVATYREMLNLKPKKSIRVAIAEILRLDSENKNLRDLRRGYRR